MNVYADESVTVLAGDCLDTLRADDLGYDHHLGYGPPAIADCSIDAVVTDPPYGLEFMGKGWHVPYHDLIKARLTKPIATVLW